MRHLDVAIGHARVAFGLVVLTVSRHDELSKCIVFG